MLNSYCTAAGAKPKLAGRIAKWEIKGNEKDKLKRDIDEFLMPTTMTRGNNKPPLTKHYAQTFNAVDMFNKLVGYINFIPRIADVDFLLLVSIVQIAIIQTWALVNDWKVWSGDEKKEGLDLAEFAKELAKELLSHK